MIEWIEPVKNFKAGDNKWKYREFLARNSRYFCQGMLIESAGNDYHLYVNKVFLYVSMTVIIVFLSTNSNVWAIPLLKGPRGITEMISGGLVQFSDFISKSPHIADQSHAQSFAEGLCQQQLILRFHNDITINIHDRTEFNPFLFFSRTTSISSAGE